MWGVHAARAVLLVVGVCVGPWAAAGPVDQPGQDIAELGKASMPGGLASLCERQASFCAPAHAAPHAPVRLSALWPQLSRINRDVNHAIASTTDSALYGRDEYWTLPVKAGDCEDYVLLKRQALLQLGLPATSLLITVVHDENGDGHAVLTVPTTEGDVVLDNRRDEILHWWETGYTFIKRQSARDAVTWVSLGQEKLQATNIASGPGLP